MKPILRPKWERTGLIYEATADFEVAPKYTLRVVRKLDFLSYHAIRLIRGQDKLAEIAEAPPEHLTRLRGQLKESERRRRSCLP